MKGRRRTGEILSAVFYYAGSLYLFSFAIPSRTVCYGRKDDSVEMFFEKKEGYFRKTDNEAVMEKVDQEGHVIGVSILNVSQNPSGVPVSVTLRDAAV